MLSQRLPKVNLQRWSPGTAAWGELLMWNSCFQWIFKVSVLLVELVFVSVFKFECNVCLELPLPTLSMFTIHSAMMTLLKD